MSLGYRCFALLCAALVSCSSGKDADDRVTNTVVVIVLDAWSAEEEPNDSVAPALVEVRKDALVFPECISACSGASGAFASILTGTFPHEHGLGSPSALGHHRLPAEVRTLAEGFRDGGFTTIGAVALPQLGDSLSGAGQGFVVYRAPEPSASAEPWSAPRVVSSVREDWTGALARNAPIFLLLQLADLRGDGGADRAVDAAVLSRHLAPLTGEDGVAAALARLETDPQGAWADLWETSARRRGSLLLAALRAALIESGIAVVDAAIRELLEDLQRFDRAQGAVVCIVGLRGAVPESARTDVALARTTVATQMWLRLPRNSGGASARPDPGVVEGRAQTIDLLPTLYSWMGWGSASDAPDGPSGWNLLDSELADGRKDALKKRIAFAEAADLTARGAYGPQGTVWTEPERGAGTPAEQQAATGTTELYDALKAWEPAERLVFTVGEEAVDTWEITVTCLGGARIRRTDGAVLGSIEQGSKSESCRIRFEAGGARDATVVTSTRHAPVLLEITRNGEAPPEDLVMMGETPLSRADFPRVDDGRGAPMQEDARSLVTVARVAGSWFRVRVAAEEAAGQVQGLLARYPPGDFLEALEVRSTGAHFQPVEGRADAVRFTGTTPLELDVRVGGGERLALSVAIDGAQVPFGAFQLEGKSLSRGPLSLYLPDWMEGTTEVLAEGDGEVAASAALRIQRRGSGLDPARTAGTSPALVRTARRLGQAE